MHPILAGDPRSPYPVLQSARTIYFAVAGDTADTAEPVAAVCRLEVSRCLYRRLLRSCRPPDPLRAPTRRGKLPLVVSFR